MKKLIADLIRRIVPPAMINRNAYRNVPPALHDLHRVTEGMLSLEEASLLYHLAKRVADGCIVEIGSYRGRSAVALARGSMNGQQVAVYAIEPHEPFTGELESV